MSENGRSSDFYKQAVWLLVGIVLSGAAMMIRGDYLGSQAADAVERRVNVRIDRELSSLGSELKEIKEELVRMREAK